MNCFSPQANLSLILFVLMNWEQIQFINTLDKSQAEGCSTNFHWISIVSKNINDLKIQHLKPWAYLHWSSFSCLFGRLERTFSRKSELWNWVLPTAYSYIGHVPVGHESLVTVSTRSWHNQFHKPDFLERSFSDFTLTNLLVFNPN